jgi:hypothetical protein
MDYLARKTTASEFYYVETASRKEAQTFLKPWFLICPHPGRTKEEIEGIYGTSY